MKKLKTLTLLILLTTTVQAETVINRFHFTDLLERCVNNNIDSNGVSTTQLDEECFSDISGWPAAGFDNTAAGFRAITLENNNCREMIFPTPTDPSVKMFTNDFYYKLPAKKNGTRLEGVSNFNSAYGKEYADFNCIGGIWSKTRIGAPTISNNNYCDQITIISPTDGSLITFNKTRKDNTATVSFDRNGFLHTSSLTCINPQRKNVIEQWNTAGLTTSSVASCNPTELTNLNWTENVDKFYELNIIGNRTFNCKTDTVTGIYPNFILNYDSTGGLIGSLGFFKNIQEAILYNNKIVGQAIVNCLNGKWVIIEKNCENESNLIPTTNKKSQTIFNRDGEPVIINEVTEYIAIL